MILKNRRTTAHLALALALAAPLAPVSAMAQVVVRPAPGRPGGPVVVQPGRPGAVVVTPAPARPGGGGAVVVQPEPGRPGAVVVQPARPGGGGAVVVQPAPGRPGAVVVAPAPARPGGAVVVAPAPSRPGPVVVDPGAGRPGVVVVGPRGVVRGAPSRVVVVGPPPAPRVITRRPPPSRHGELWIEPYWGWTGAGWEWIDGHWELPPQSGAIWIAPQWDGSGWIPGYWTMASVYQQAPQVVGMAYQVGAYTSGALTMNDPRDASGGPFHDYAVWMNARDMATFVVSGGPSDRFAGRRVDVAMTMLLDGRPIASGTLTGPNDAQLTFTAPRAAIYTLRISTRGGPAGTGSYVLESAPGQWAPQVNPYDQFWGPTYAPPQPAYPPPQPAYPPPQPVYPQVPDCRSTLIQMGHASTALMFCDNAEPYCADALLRMGHAPTNLMFCQGVQPQCAVQLLQSGRSPTELQFCR
ncbi:MAG: hypothetical protein ACK6CU_21495 [Deltaproteobacteria bacterium]